MKNIITRDWIREDAVFYASQQTKYSKDELCHIIDYCKQKLIESGARRGDKIGMSLITIDIFYTALLFAIFELGMKLTILHRMHSLEETTKPKAKSHMPLNFFVCYTTKDYTTTHITTEYYKKNSKKSISINDEWSLKEALSFSGVTPVWAEPTDDLLLCNSSGTTGNPKLIYHTHEYLYTLCSYNWEPLDLKNDDAVFHMSSINHGASLSVFYLPSLKKCPVHYLDMHKPVTISYATSVFESCRDHNIKKLLSPNAVVTDSIIDVINKDSIGLPNTTFIVVSFINPKWLNVVKTGKLKKIISAFGCSETGGPLLIPHIDINTDVESFNPRFLGRPTTGFYITKQIDGLLTVDLPNNKRVITEDIVEEKEDGFYFISKNKLRKISDIDVNPLDIVDRIDHLCSRNKFEVVVDEVYNELYIVTNDETLVKNIDQVKTILHNFFPVEIKLTDILLMKDFDRATVAVKPDREKLLEFIDNHRKHK